jgi:WD40 repeat protein
VSSVAYSPDGRHIISGSRDSTIRIWDAEAGSTVGKPLEGHTSWVSSVAYSPDGRHIISGSGDNTIRIWDAEAGSAVGNSLKGHTDYVRSVDYTPDGRHIISGSHDNTIRIWDSSSNIPIRMTSSATEAALPDTEGWVKDPVGGLIYWVPHDCRAGLHSPALLTIPRASPVRSASLQFDQFAFGTSWTQIFNTTRT